MSDELVVLPPIESNKTTPGTGLIDHINDLNGRVSAIEGGIENIGGPFLPLDGSVAMVGPLKLNNSYNSNPADISKGVIFYQGSGNDMGIAASGQPDADMGVDASQGRLNIVTGHPDNNIYLRVDADRAFASKRGLELIAGHSVYIEGQNTDERYWLRTEEIIGTPGPQGEKGEQGIQGVQGEKGDTGEVGPAGPKGDTGDKGEQGATGPAGEQGVPGVNGASGGATVGDGKWGFQTADHAGWVILNGRAITALTATQQTAAASLGFTTNLPDAFQCVPIQNGKTPLGTVDGSMQRILTANQMPKHHHPAKACTNDEGTVGFSELLTGYTMPNTIGIVWRRPATIANHDNGNLALSGRMMDDAGNDEPLDITPKSMAVNQFVYLGA